MSPAGRHHYNLSQNVDHSFVPSLSPEAFTFVGVRWFDQATDWLLLWASIASHFSEWKGWTNWSYPGLHLLRLPWLLSPKLLIKGWTAPPERNPALRDAAQASHPHDLTSPGYAGSVPLERTVPSPTVLLVLFWPELCVNLGEGRHAAGIGTLTGLLSQDQPYCTSVENWPQCQMFGINRLCSPSARSIYFGQAF